MSSYPKLKNFCRTDPEVINAVFPIVAVTSYGNGVMRVHRECKLKYNDYDPNGRKDRKIKMLTKKSLAKLTATVQATSIEFKTMITLTYPRFFPKDGRVVKKDLNAVLGNMRNNAKFDYLWFLEFQERGAPHFHILTTHDGITPKMRIDLAYWWVGRIKDSEWFVDSVIMESVSCGMCQDKIMTSEITKAFKVSSHRDTWQMVREKDGAKRYVTKYASKPEQKEVPEYYDNVGRFWGCSKGVMLSGGVKKTTGQYDLQEYLKNTRHPAAKFDVIPKYLWNVQNT